MQYKVKNGLTKEAIRSCLPPRYRPLISDELPGPPYTLLLFRSDRNDVIMSRVVEAALSDVIAESETLIAVAGCFTAEGLEILHARRAAVLQLSEFYWTDESYQAVRNR